MADDYRRFEQPVCDDADEQQDGNDDGWNQEFHEVSRSKRARLAAPAGQRGRVVDARSRDAEEGCGADGEAR